MECKHKELKIVHRRTGGTAWDVFICQEPSCSTEFKEHQVVILSKEKADKMQAVIEAGMKMNKYKRSSRYWQEKDRFDKALKVLDAGGK